MNKPIEPYHARIAEITDCVMCKSYQYSPTMNRWYCEKLGLSFDVPKDRIPDDCPLPRKLWGCTDSQLTARIKTIITEINDKIAYHNQALHNRGRKLHWERVDYHRNQIDTVQKIRDKLEEALV